MVALNFPNHFIHTVMACTTSTCYSLLLNSFPTPTFHARRGLHQGDPLSPLFFVISMEYLSRLLRRIEDRYCFHPRCNKIKLSHLCFADDLMLFSKGDLSSIQIIYKGLDVFARSVC